MFRRTPNFFRNGKLQTFISERFQYFHHYWETTKAHDNDIFLDTIRFESHRSLLTRVEHQLDYNFDHSFDKFMRLFIHHKLFDHSNIIAGDPQIQSLKRTIITYLNTSPHKDKKNYSTHYTLQIRATFGQLKSILLDQYHMKLKKHLYKVIATNKPLNSQDKETIRFLVNAFIVELYYHDYSEEFISRIPEIIYPGHVLHEFPFKKVRSDFAKKEDYEAYVKEERKKMTLDKYLSALVNLIRRPINNGYYVFKVDGIALIEPHPIVLDEVIFYNPQNVRMLNIEHFKEDHKSHYIYAEDFYFARDGKVDETKKSRCNALIKAKYRSHENIESHNNFFQAFHKVSNTLNILTKVLNGYGGTGNAKPEVDIKNNIKLHNDKKPARYSFSIFYDHFREVKIVDQQSLTYFTKEIGFINRINPNTRVGSILLEIISIHGKFSKSVELFNFLDLWIRWESLFKNDKEKLKEAIQDCFYIKYKKNYLSYVKVFLYFKIGEEYPNSGTGCWILTEQQLKQVGLEIKTHQIVSTKKFKNNLNFIPNHLPIEIIKDTVAMANEFTNQSTTFFSKLNDWINNVVEDVYVERNMEVHSNIKNDLSTIRLKEDFLTISRTLFDYIVEFNLKRNPDIEVVLRRIKAYKNTI